MHEVLQRMPIYGEYHHLVQELYFHPDKFRRYFRMTKEQFDRLLGLIEDDIQKKKNTKWKNAITPRERPSICLRSVRMLNYYFCTNHLLQVHNLHIHNFITHHRNVSKLSNLTIYDNCVYPKLSELL